MNLHPGDVTGVIEILNRLYLELLAIEEPHALVFGNGDFRPRIEYFHDAVRAFTESNPRAFEWGGRLSVEMLAYDLTCIRYIQAMPLASFDKGGAGRSPLKDIHSNHAHVPAAAKPDRLAKIRISELYQQYGVLFSTLFKPYADHNYHERADAMNEEVKQLSAILHALEAGDNARVENAIAHLDNAELRQFLFGQLEKKGKKDVIPAVKDATKKTDNALNALENAHLQFGTAQLALYEEGKEVVKKLAAHGMNLAGRFVESAMAAAKAEKGRGGR